MRPLIHEIATGHSPESLVDRVREEPGAVLLRTASFEQSQARYSFVATRPFLTFRAWGSRCETRSPQGGLEFNYGDPWRTLDALLARYELLDEIDLPFPLGGCFGFWGYDLKNFVEPRLPRRAVNDLEVPDCHLGFYDSLVVFDHRLAKTWIVSTGLEADGSRNEKRAHEQLAFWEEALTEDNGTQSPVGRSRGAMKLGSRLTRKIVSNISRSDFIAAVNRAQNYIRAGDIYQV